MVGLIHLNARCVSLRARADEARMVAGVMRDQQSQQMMFRMAHAYETMALILEKTSEHATSAADTNVV
jgi:hypothetical protein